jgi:nucleoside-diphosphate kinase
MIEQTLVIIKPDAVEKGIMGEIIKRIEGKGWRVAAIERVKLSRTQAEEFYIVYNDQPFYEKLVDYMISAPCFPMVVEGENVICGIRDLIGDTDPVRAKKGTIRRDYATNVTVNCVHASDGPASAEKEIHFFFSRRGLI